MGMWNLLVATEQLLDTLHRNLDWRKPSWTLHALLLPIVDDLGWTKPHIVLAETRRFRLAPHPAGTGDDVQQLRHRGPAL